MNEKNHSTKTSDEPATSRLRFLRAGAAAAGVALLGNAFKATPNLAAAQDQPELDEAQLLFVQNARDVAVNKGRLTLIGVNPTTIFFSDRPKRIKLISLELKMRYLSRLKKMTLHWTVIAMIAIMMITTGSTLAPASEETEGKKESIESRHRVELFVGNTHDDGENGFSIGLGYEYRIVELIGVGLFAEYADGDFREWVFGAPLYIHPYKGWRLLMAPGVDVERGEKGDPEFLIRIGLAYEFEIDQWSVTPEFNVDFVDNDEVFVYGVSFGWGF